MQAIQLSSTANIILHTGRHNHTPQRLHKLQQALQPSAMSAAENTNSNLEVALLGSSTTCGGLAAQVCANMLSPRSCSCTSRPASSEACIADGCVVSSLPLLAPTLADTAVAATGAATARQAAALGGNRCGRGGSCPTRGRLGRTLAWSCPRDPLLGQGNGGPA